MDSTTNTNSQAPQVKEIPVKEKSFGYILSLRLREFDMSKEKVVEAFKKAEFDEKFIPNERQPKRAFQKALKESIQGETGFMIRPLIKDKGTMTSGLVREDKDQDEKNLNYSVCNILTLNSQLEVIQGKSDFRTQAVVDSYKDYRNKLGSIEVALKLKEILFASLSIEILCNKCVFVPNKYKADMDKIVCLFKNLKESGAPAEVEIISVENDTQTRNTIVSQFLAQTMESLQQEIDFCLKQRDDFSKGELKFLRATAFRRQHAKIQLIRDRIATYVPLLQLSPEEDKPIIDKFVELDGELTKNMELTQAPKMRKGKLKLTDLPSV